VPEGDTIHRWAAALRDALTGKPLRRVEIRRDPRGLRPPAAGTRVEGVEARGKHLLVHFDDGATLHTHMQLHGTWQLYAPGARWRRPAHTARAVIEADDGTTAVCFGAPVVELRRDGAVRPTSRAGRSLARLGPALCDAAVDLDAVLDRLDRLPATTPLGDALLDQRIGAGIGNVFKSEICWAERVHPSTPLGTLDRTARRRVYATAHRQLLANLGPGRRITHRGGLAVYGKARRPCPRCRTPIRRARAGDDERVTYWCPRCQPEPEPAEPPAAPTAPTTPDIRG
jgi:endonuclease-8